MKKLLSLASVLLALTAVSPSFAAMINGQINIGALGSTVTVDQTANTVAFSPTANAVTNNAIVTFTAGSYTSVALATPVKYFDFSYALGPTSQLLWSIPGIANFTLLNYSLVDETSGVGGVVLQGTGMATLSGFDPTPGFWSFSADRASNTALFSFSSTNISPIPGVPDSGTTALLLGVGLMAVGVVSRRLKR